MQACEADVARWRETRAGSVALAAQLKALWPATLLLVVGLGGLAAATLAPTGKGDQYAVIAPPWSSLARTFAVIRGAQGEVVQISPPTITGTIVIAHARRPDFVAAAYRAGAWLVIDPMRLRGCIGFQRVGAQSESKARP
jgi:hypothetical protein